AAHFLLARTCRRAGDFAAAGAHLGEAERRGWVAEAVGLERLLLQAQSRAVRAAGPTLRGYLAAGHPEEGLILEALAAGCLQGNFLEEAHRWTSIWVERHPGDWRARLWHGRVLEQGLSYDLAAEQYRRVLERKPGHAEAHLRRGEVLLWRGQYAEALPDLQAYLRGDPHHPAALLGLARCQRCLDPPGAARATLERLLARHP